MKEKRNRVDRKRMLHDFFMRKLWLNIRKDFDKIFTGYHVLKGDLLHEKAIHWLDEYLEEFLMVVFLIAMTLIMGIQVFSRYILGVSLSWSEEITRYLFIWSAFLSVSLCTKNVYRLKLTNLSSYFREEENRYLRF